MGILKSFCSEKSRLSTPGLRMLEKKRGASPKALVTSQQNSGAGAELTKHGPGHVPAKSKAWLLNQSFGLRREPEIQGLAIIVERSSSTPAQLHNPDESSVIPEGLPA